MLKRGLMLTVMILAALMFTLPVTAKITTPDSLDSPHTIPATGTIEAAFSPEGGITGMIVKELGMARNSIEVQAYSFTSAPIAKALVDAFRRKVLVRIIVDKSQQTVRYSVVAYLTNAGIPVHVDRDFQIAHSKIMIIDQTDVITGSFNFTKAAEESNAENCLILRGNKPLADLYEKNWQWRWNGTE